MIELKQVLCPVDFSDFSRHALAQAAVIARWYDAALTVFHAYPAGPPPVLLGAYLAPISTEPVPPPTPETHNEILAELKRFAGAVNTADVLVRFEARPGGAVQAILDEAKSLSADLIVLGTHGRSGLDRLLLGSVAERVLRKARCPVLTVPPPVSGVEEDALRLFKRILCPVDFSDPSFAALNYALSLAKEADAQLLLMHVITGMPDMSEWKQPNPVVLDYLRVTEEEALARLRGAVPKEAHAWCQPEEILATGTPYREILRVARQRDVHLIVMGIYGRNPLDLLFFGSTAHQVVRTASCPVLTLRG